jgi:Arc-like DNA binding domain
MSNKVGAQNGEKYLVRFKPGQRSLIKQNAAKNNRTMNAEVLSLLEKGMEACYGEKQTARRPKKSPEVR